MVENQQDQPKRIVYCNNCGFARLEILYTEGDNLYTRCLSCGDMSYIIYRIPNVKEMSKQFEKKEVKYLG